MGKVKLWTGRYNYTIESRFVSSSPIRISRKSKSEFGVSTVIRNIRMTAQQAVAERKKVSRPDVIKQAGGIPIKEASLPSSTERKLTLIITTAINACKCKEGRTQLTDVAAIIRSQNKGFTPKGYGFKNYKEMILALHQSFDLSDALEVRQKESITGEKVRRKKIGQLTGKENTSQVRESETLSRKVFALIDRAFAIAPLTAGGVKLGDLYECLSQLDPNFHIQSFGYSSLSGFLLAHNEIYRIDYLEINPRNFTPIVTRINKSE